MSSRGGVCSEESSESVSESRDGESVGAEDRTVKQTRNMCRHRPRLRRDQGLEIDSKRQGMGAGSLAMLRLGYAYHADFSARCGVVFNTIPRGESPTT